MTFKEFYFTRGKGWYRIEELPEDVRKDLFELLEAEDKRIGIVVYHSHVSENNDIHFEGMKIGYYWRTFKPCLQMEPWNWFWRLKKITY